MNRKFMNDYYWWANIYKNFKLSLNSIRLGCSDYTREIYRFSDKFEKRFLYRNRLNEEELEELNRYTDNIIVKYMDSMNSINKDVC